MWQDLRLAWRVLCKSPGFTAIVVLTFALGIGANTAMFSIVNGALLQPLPYKDPERLIDIMDASVKDASLSNTFLTYDDFEEYEKHPELFEKLAFVSWATSGSTLTGRGRARDVLAIPVSSDFFAVPGVAPLWGRTFDRSDLYAGCSVVLSYRFWRDTLGADPLAIGQVLALDRQTCTVLGVMPAGFEFYPRDTELWTLLRPGDPRPHDRVLGMVTARLRPGVTMSRVEAELRPAHRGIHPSDWQRNFVPVANRLQAEFTFFAGRNIRTTMVTLVAAIGFVLLIACLNVANLLLGRASVRSREFAVRSALGSSRFRLIRQLLIESVLLAWIGGLAGLAVAVGCIRYFLAVSPIDLPVGSDVSLNFPVFAFAAVVTFGTALVAGLAPALAGSRVAHNSALRAAGRGSLQGANRRLTQGLVAVEIALSLLLIGGASLLIRSVLKMDSAPLGFDATSVTVMSIRLPEQTYRDAAAKIRFFQDVRRTVQSVPGVESTAIAATMPPYGSGFYEIQVEGTARTSVQDVGQNAVSADYFDVLRIPVKRGRAFTESDRAGSTPVAVINEALVKKYFQGVDPIGRRIRSFGFEEGHWATIVGVVGTNKIPDFLHEMSWRVEFGVYRPLEQEAPGSIALEVRTRPDVGSTSRAVEKAVAAVDQDVPLGAMTTMRALLGSQLAYPRFRALLTGMFAGLALLLAALGLYGLLAQYVAQRTRELGLRRALGASAGSVVRLIFIQAGWPVIVGLTVGVLSIVGLTRYLSSLLFEVSAFDPSSLSLTAFALVVTACVAAARPALVAASIDPGTALRDE
ncbi:MAG: hypothetical protein JWN34_626 [Bryobacterales bacterium]|nr:hypothetical protein [Bryobacterales bacterium]